MKNQRNLIYGGFDNDKGVAFSSIFTLYPGDNYFIYPGVSTTTLNKTQPSRITNANDMSYYALTRDAKNNIQAVEDYLEVVRGDTNLAPNNVIESKFANPFTVLKLRFGIQINEPKKFKQYVFAV